MYCKSEKLRLIGSFAAFQELEGVEVFSLPPVTLADWTSSFACGEEDDKF